MKDEASRDRLRRWAFGPERRRALVCASAMLVAACASSGRAAPTSEPTLGPDERPETPRGEDATTERPEPTRRDEPRAPLVGGCGAASRDLEPRYVLPFPVGDEFELTQGNCGSASHGGRFSYAFDFRMPMGTPLIAARDGVVFTVRADSPDGTRAVGDENYVFIEHEDGEFSRYIHLQRAGVLVRRGERVSRGDTIALSGNSGRSAFPHLHFDVAIGCRSGPCVTVEAAFLNATPPIPIERVTYAAQAEGGTR